MNSKIKIRLMISIAILSLSFAIVVIKDRTPATDIKQPDTSQQEVQEQVIVVDISGAVVNPGVYELKSGSRVFEVINMAGGLLEDAFLKGIDLAKILVDEDKIVIPKHDLMSNSQGLISISVVDEGENIIYISVEGAVKNPSIVVINIDKRVVDAIEGAGGLLDQADDMGVNMAQKLEDGMTITVPYVLTEEEKANRVNINTASKEDLMALEGIGEVIASNIVDYRQNNGYFNTVEELLNISGIGEKKLDIIREKIVVY